MPVLPVSSLIWAVPLTVGGLQRIPILLCPKEPPPDSALQWIFFRVETEWCRMLIKAEQRDSALNLQDLAAGTREEDEQQLLPLEQSKDTV